VKTFCYGKRFCVNLFTGMEEKLASYRLRKRRLEKLNSLKEKFFKMVSINVGSGSGTKEETRLKIEVSDVIIC
jgi:hypothetical protein